MARADQSTAERRVNSQGEPRSFDTDSAVADFFQNKGQVVRSVLARGRRSVSTTSVNGQEARAVSQPASTGHEQNAENLSQILTFPQRRARQAPAVTLHALQEWEGYILEIRPEDVVARLIDLTAGASQEEEEAVIPLTEISDDDAVKMREGSIFRWVIGYERSAAGTKKRVSQIVFRDLPSVTKSDLQDGQAWADRISESFDR